MCFCSVYIKASRCNQADVKAFFFVVFPFALISQLVSAPHISNLRPPGDDKLPRQYAETFGF